MTRLIQIKKGSVRRVGLVEEPHVPNIEHHHFKFLAYRRPGDIHVHFFGTDCLSFSNQIRLEDGVVMQVAAEGFGRPLLNPVRVEKSKPGIVKVVPLG